MFEKPATATHLVGTLADVERDRETLLRLLHSTIERYQLGMQTVVPHERFWIDEGFLSLVLSISKRSRSPVPIEPYLANIPLPEVVICIEAPVEVCLERQRDRGRVVPTGETPTEQRANQAAIHARLTDMLESLPDSTTLITVSNTGTVAGPLDEFNRSLRAVGGRSRRYS